jgi:hypothetical protein
MTTTKSDLTETETTDGLLSDAEVLLTQAITKLGIAKHKEIRRMQSTDDDERKTHALANLSLARAMVLVREAMEIVSC